MRTSLLCVALSVCATLALTGCANTTHYINLDPSVELQSAQLSNSHPITVNTSTKLGKKIGAIDTAINEHADLFISNKVEESINNRVIQGLSSLGYKLDQGSLPASTLEIEVTDISYTTSTKALKTIATIKFGVTARLSAKGKVYTANYASEKIDEYGSLPDQEEVQEVLNKLAGETVNRLLNDSNIRVLLK